MEEKVRFQNHYGWIETVHSLDVLKNYTVFQNHYGWIETVSSPARKRNAS